MTFILAPQKQRGTPGGHFKWDYLAASDTIKIKNFALARSRCSSFDSLLIFNPGAPMGPHGAQGLKLPPVPLWEPHWGPMGPIGAPGLKINKNSHEEHRERASGSERASAKLIILIVSRVLLNSIHQPQSMPAFNTPK